MNSTGMARRVDDLGRIVLPVEMRRLFGIRPGDAMEISVSNGTIQLRKIEARCVFCDSEENLLDHRGKKICAECAADVPQGDRP